MGRKVQIRASYQQDAGYLMRLAQAVELDTKRPVEWRQTVQSKINELAVLFLRDAGVLPPEPAPAAQVKSPKK